MQIYVVPIREKFIRGAQTHFAGTLSTKTNVNQKHNRVQSLNAKEKIRYRPHLYSVFPKATQDTFPKRSWDQSEKNAALLRGSNRCYRILQYPLYDSDGSAGRLLPLM